MKTAKELADERLHSGPEPTKSKRRRTGDEQLGLKLRALRLEYGLSLRQVRTATGIPNPTLSQAETGYVMPSVKTIAILIAFYETTFKHLCGHMVQAAKDGS